MELLQRGVLQQRGEARHGLLEEFRAHELVGVDVLQQQREGHGGEVALGVVDAVEERQQRVAEVLQQRRLQMLHKRRE